MSKKKNKKSVKKNLSKKPGARKPASKKTSAKKKKAVKKAVKKKPASKKAKPARKPAKKTVKKPLSRKPAVKKKLVKKKLAKKKALKKAPKKPVKKVIAKKAPVKKALKKITLNKAPLKAAPAKKTAPQSGATPAKTALKVLKSNPQPITPKAVSVKPAESNPEENKVVRIVKQMVKGEPLPNVKRSVIIDIKTGPEPPGRFELEYVVHASAQILFEFLTTPSGLSEWFCDDVNIRNGVYSFKWEDNEQNARVVKLVEEKLVRFQWVEKQDNSYFEFRIERDDLTNDISLIIVDFADTAEEKASSTLLWNSQIDKLLHVLGAYF